MSNQKCETRIDENLKDTLETLKSLWAAYNQEEVDCPRCDGISVTSPQCDTCTIDMELHENDCNFSDDVCPHDDIETVECEQCSGTGFIQLGDEDGNHPELGHLWEYGLGFDYVAPETFEDQNEGYFRYQLSWGGPSDEFRIYADQGPRGWHVYRIEYWFLDWFDGASRTLNGSDRDFMLNIIQQFDDTETMTHEYEKAMEL